MITEEILIDLEKVKDKNDLFDLFDKTFGFPEWFGNNWDALEESLKTLGSVNYGFVFETKFPIFLKIKNINSSQLNNKDILLLKNILSSVSRYYQSENKIFQYSFKKFNYYCDNVSISRSKNRKRLVNLY